MHDRTLSERGEPATDFEVTLDEVPEGEHRSALSFPFHFQPVGGYQDVIEPLDGTVVVDLVYRVFGRPRHW